MLRRVVEVVWIVICSLLLTRESERCVCVPMHVYCTYLREGRDSLY